MIFSYRGDVPQYRAKALRLKKAKRAVDDDEATERNRIWREECLPRLVPPELLLSQQTVLAEAGWVKRLLSNAEPHRPEARRVDAVDVDREVVEFTLCEDLRSIDSVDGEFALGVEIKVSPLRSIYPELTATAQMGFLTLCHVNCPKRGGRDQVASLQVLPASASARAHHR